MMNLDKKNFFSATKNVAKRSTATMLCMVMAGLFLAYGCEKTDTPTGGDSRGDENDTIIKSDSNLTLRNTTWKLVGIVDAETDSIKVLDPKLEYNEELCLPVDEWYLLVFDETDTIFYKSTAIKWSISIYEVDYIMDSIRYIGGKIETMIGDTFDGLLYYRIFKDELRQMQPFSLKENEFRWYYNDKKNYLLFERRLP